MLLPAVALLNACGGGGMEADSCPSMPVQDRTSREEEPALCTNFTSSLVVKDRMGQQVTRFSAGETVFFEATVTNSSSEAVTVTKPNGCGQISFDAFKSTAQLDWSSLTGAACTAALENVTYAPGETKRFTAQWNQSLCQGQQASVGQYTVRMQDSTQCFRRTNRSTSFTLQ